MDTKIDPNTPPVSAEELARDAMATGADPEAAPLVEAGEASAEEGGPDVAIASELTKLPPG